MIVADFSDQVRPGVAPMVFGRAPRAARSGLVLARVPTTLPPRPACWGRSTEEI